MAQDPVLPTPRELGSRPWTGPGTRQEGRRVRRTALLATGLVAGAVLTGCASGADVREAASTAAPPPSAQAAAPSAAADLAAGLLPAEAFGPGARVVPVSGEQLSRGALGGMGSPADVEVTPGSCTAALQALPLHQPPAAEDLAAQVAVQGTTYTAELLAVAGPAAELVGRVPGLVAQCPQVAVSSPERGSATVDLATFDVPDLGDASVGVSVEVAVTEPGGAQREASGLVGLVRDGDRVVALATADREGAEPDRAAFTALLEEAYDTQAAAD
ncbi:hypothetical protein [Geodermatophilus poikilotrophus]|uniref:DUF5642 domain-containing protein n=1 Tax=Geodermatophilus poikilotrophus TaxID=1333667 RepID=A0A1I0D0R1_9ACTN|nr:hypothetical protein [Geodermatophilus poikilotrophus]SET25474.1 hypothetical protein SAMN04488546_1852 [Geodermatophilus poikilotrophus]